MRHTEIKIELLCLCFWSFSQKKKFQRKVSETAARGSTSWPAESWAEVRSRRNTEVSQHGILDINAVWKWILYKWKV